MNKDIKLVSYDEYASIKVDGETFDFWNDATPHEHLEKVSSFLDAIGVKHQFILDGEED